MALKPLTYEDPLFQLLRDGNVNEFNAPKSANPTLQLGNGDFRHLDMRGLDASGISGALFPAELAAEEIALSVNRATRLRYHK